MALHSELRLDLGFDVVNNETLVALNIAHVLGDGSLCTDPKLRGLATQKGDVCDLPG
jgi:hypothetical protein